MIALPVTLRGGEERRIPVAPLVLALVLLAMIPLGQYLASERYAMLIAAALLMVQTFLVFQHWRLAVYLLFVYVLVEGFIVNYFGGRGELNLIKDGLILTVFLALLFRLVVLRQPLFAAAPWKVPLAGFALLYVLQVFNPALPSIAVGLIGVRVTLLFITCAVIGYWFFYRREMVQHYLIFQTLVSIPVSLFGIAQYFLGPAWLLSLSPGFARAIVYAGGRTNREVMFRTISTFASTAGFSAYLWVTIVLTFAAYRLARTRAQRSLALCAFVLQGVAMFTTGGRSPVVWTALSILIAILLMRRLKYFVFATCAGLIVFVLSLQLLGGVIEGRFGTLLNKEVVIDRNAPLILQMSAAMKAPPEGLGAGRMATAAQRYDPSMNFSLVENAFAKVRLEAGLPGFILFCVAFFALALDIFFCGLRFQDPGLRTISSSATGFLLTAIAIFPLGTPLDLPPLNFYFWFLLGMLYALRRIESGEAAANRSPASSSCYQKRALKNTA